MRFVFSRLFASFAFATLTTAIPQTQIAQAQTAWVGIWAAAPSAATNSSGALAGPTTLREIVHVSRGGASVRVTFSNELGTDPLTISAAHLALRRENDAIAPTSDHTLTFSGQPGFVIPPGAVAVSDPLTMSVAPAADLAISLLLPAQPLRVRTEHSLGLQTNYEADGDQLGSPSLQEPRPFGQWRFLKNVEVSGPGAAIVTLGDSITDGFKSTSGANRRWPDILAQRLQADRKLRTLAVLNEGISGNRVLHNNAGPNALARFDRDVLSQSGVRYLIVLEGINDISRTGDPKEPGDAITAEQLIGAYQQMIDRAHAHGIKVFGATLTPFLGAGAATAARETMRQTVNTWIRTSGHFDGIVDFDQATRDPAKPDAFSSTADSGDHLHPGDAGYKAMADSIDLQLFTR